MTSRNAVMEHLERAVDKLVEETGVQARREAVALIRGAMADLDPKGRRASGETSDVLAFQKKFGHMFQTGHGIPLDEHATLRRPRHMTQRKLAERANFLREELDEFLTSAGLEWAEAEGRGFVAYPMNSGSEPIPQDLAGMADALVDIVYVAKGTANLLGLPWDELWDDVHRANMEKVAGERMRAGVWCTRDALKPDGWRPPQTDDILAAAGYVEDGLQAEWDDPEHCPGGPQSAVAS